MRFSEIGPDFPTALITNMRRGDVVFLCGAGVSQRAGLPDFENLVEGVYAAVGEDRDPFEQRAFVQKKFDECLGSLARRIVDERDIVRAASRLLQPTDAATLDAHESILRLSAEADGSPILVTTNFDTLFERAMHARTGQAVRPLSSAGSSIPAPGSKRFSGIVHLHGRLHDATLELEETDLVLTSAQFGAA
jgi:NAD-dependent SIR2 family protein deacetylase